jgi:CRISPR/Cas system-associated exonuclease Cas4 (RecB family)
MKDIDFSKIYSVSRLNLFDQCPKAYHFSYLDPVYSKMKAKLRKDPDNIFPFNTLGRAVHDALTLFFHLEKEKDLKNLKDQFKLAWRAEAMPNKLPPPGKWGGFSSLEEERQYYKDGLSMLVNFYKNFDLSFDIFYLPTKNVLKSIEDYKKLIKPISKNYDISGKFDLVVKLKDSLGIVDFKTGKSEEKDSFQLRFYKLLAELNFEKSVDKASFYYLKTGNIKEFKLKHISKSAVKDEVLEKIKTINETKEFEPRPSKLCKYCMFKNFCPAKTKVKELIKEPEDEDLAEDLPF